MDIFTIPLMKKTGFKATVASGVEAATSTGGQIMPPVMGAAAFIMAQLLGVPYAHIIVAAAIPAILYYLALYFMIDFFALREGIKAIPKEDMPDVKKGLKERAHLLIPLVIIVWAIVSEHTIYTSALWAIGAVVITSFFRKATRMNIKGILNAMESGSKEAVGIAIPCAVAGIIVGMVVHTGLGLKFTGLVLVLAKDSLLPYPFLDYDRLSHSGDGDANHTGLPDCSRAHRAGCDQVGNRPAGHPYVHFLLCRDLHDHPACRIGSLCRCGHRRSQHVAVRAGSL